VTLSDDVPRSIVVLAGPTACGKSEVALLLAEQLGGEIVSVDSMQVYRGMDIGTAKPSSAERARVPHHLIDVVGLTEPFDAAQFARAAHTAVASIHARGKRAILCGGTGLYLSAFFAGVGDAPAADAELRRELEGTPLDNLLRELAERDPATYAKIDRKNPRRVIRALEVIRKTGRPFSAQKSDWASRKATPHVFALRRATDDLHKRINERVDAMFANGLVDETRRLLDQGLAENRTAMQALGYRQVVEHLRDERSLPETIELIKLRTRQFAKRQMTWFRGQLKPDWIDVAPGETAADVTSRIARALRER
jgi:tRNA dimethylallyltransferase